MTQQQGLLVVSIPITLARTQLVAEHKTS
jgi:hypothetical protein